MTTDEADAHAWLLAFYEQQFWERFMHAELKFCWLPVRDYETGKLSWLKKMIKAQSRSGADRHYYPERFTILALEKL
jgi:hypothetical protein